MNIFCFGPYRVPTNFRRKKSLMTILILCDGQKAILVTNGKELCPKIDKIHRLMSGIMDTAKK
jgi:nitroimidazol reductase NimA-like FMN-containing flavoprotein (pyridoxamine 5'-phosphate oxidase superfamily)